MGFETHFLFITLLDSHPMIDAYGSQSGKAFGWLESIWRLTNEGN